MVLVNSRCFGSEKVVLSFEACFLQSIGILPLLRVSSSPARSKNYSILSPYVLGLFAGIWFVKPYALERPRGEKNFHCIPNNLCSYCSPFDREFPREKHKFGSLKEQQLNGTIFGRPNTCSSMCGIVWEGKLHFHDSAAVKCRIGWNCSLAIYMYCITHRNGSASCEESPLRAIWQE